MSWFRKNYDLLIFAIPNGGWRHPVVARKLKNEGVVKGMPDLCIPAAKLFIEMKREKGGHVSEDQKKVRDNLVACGYIVRVCKGQEEAKAAVLDVIGKRV